MEAPFSSSSVLIIIPKAFVQLASYFFSLGTASVQGRGWGGELVRVAGCNSCCHRSTLQFLLCWKCSAGAENCLLAIPVGNPSCLARCRANLHIVDGLLQLRCLQIQPKWKEGIDSLNVFLWNNNPCSLRNIFKIPGVFHWDRKVPRVFVCLFIRAAPLACLMCIKNLECVLKEELSFLKTYH